MITLQLLFDAADFGRDVGRRDTHDSGDLVVAVSIQVQNDERPVEVRPAGRSADAGSDVVTGGVHHPVGRGQIQAELIDGHRLPNSAALAPIEGNRHVHGNPVHRGRKPVPVVELAERPPELGDDVLNEVAAIPLDSCSTRWRPYRGCACAPRGAPQTGLDRGVPSSCLDLLFAGGGEISHTCRPGRHEGHGGPTHTEEVATRHAGTIGALRAAARVQARRGVGPGLPLNAAIEGSGFLARPNPTARGEAQRERIARRGSCKGGLPPKSGERHCRRITPVTGIRVRRDGCRPSPLRL